jgi:hypothetical protein
MAIEPVPSPELDAIATIIDPDCFGIDPRHLTNNMYFRRLDARKKAAAILALIKELV